MAMLLGMVWPCLGEKIVLHSGKIVEGEMIHMTADTITLEVFGVPTTYDLADVASIDGEPFVAPPKLIAPDAVKKTAAATETGAANKLIARQPKQQSVQPEAVPAKQAAVRKPSAQEQQAPQKMEPLGSSQPFVAIQRNIDDARAYFEIGYIHQSLGEDELAVENYKKALAIDPNLGQTFFNEALDEYYLNNHTAARHNLMRAKALFEVQDDFRMIQLINEQIREFFQPKIPEDEEIERD